MFNKTEIAKPKLCPLQVFNFLINYMVLISKHQPVLTQGIKCAYFTVKEN